MLFRREILEGIAAGRVTLAFRRWRRAPPANSSSLRSPVGVLCLDRVTVVDEGDITPDDVRRTGMTIDELRASLAGDGTLLRIELRLAGDDPRIALRDRLPQHAELDGIVAKLAGIDAASARPWTTRYLQLIANQPGIVSRVIARRQCGRAALQASRPPTEGARPDREPRGRLSPLAARPRGTRTSHPRGFALTPPHAFARRSAGALRRSSPAPPRSAGQLATSSPGLEH